METMKKSKSLLTTGLIAALVIGQIFTSYSLYKIQKNITIHKFKENVLDILTISDIAKIQYQIDILKKSLQQEDIQDNIVPTPIPNKQGVFDI